MTDTTAIRSIVVAHQDFLRGIESIADTVDAWEQCPFGPQEMERWVRAGCFTAWAASDLHCAGLDPEACGRLRDRHGSTLAYSYANGDSDLEGVQLRVEVEASTTTTTTGD